MNLILFDINTEGLKPLTFTRPAADLRVGILTIKEKWEKYLDRDASFLSYEHLSEKFGTIYQDQNLYVNGKALPTKQLASEIKQLGTGDSLFYEGELIAHCAEERLSLNELEAIPVGTREINEMNLVHYAYNIFSLNHQELERDFDLLTEGRNSAEIDNSNTLIGDRVFVEEGAKVQASVLNSSTGPVYIARDAEIMEGSLVRGPFALCSNGVVKMGAKVYGATTVGPYCKVGGEINNVVFHGYSNKGHDGFLGNAVIGEWCNIGADSNNSNLKNNYDQVKLWNYGTGRFSPTGLQFCGLIMGDHSKCGINTMFNTGTVVGVSANIFGSGFPRNFVPSFSWGGSSGFSTYQIKKAFETAEIVMKRRGIALSDADKNILKHIFERSSEYRIWDRK